MTILVSLVFTASMLLILPVPAFADALDWTTIGELGGGQVLDLAYDGTNDNLFAGTDLGYVYRNTDPGVGNTWSGAGNPAPLGEEIAGLAYDGANNILYAGCTDGHVYRNTDPGTGNNWQNGGGMSDHSISSILYDSTHNILYAGCDDGKVYGNTDPGTGTTWNYTGTTGGWVEAFAYDSTYDILYAGCNNGNVYRNLDPGSSEVWEDAGDISDWSVGDLAYDGANHILYAGCNDTHVYRNTDPGAGNIWNDAGQTGLAAPGSLSYDGTMDILYAGCSDGSVYRNTSPGIGGTWHHAGDASRGTIYSLAFDGLNLYAGCADGHVYRNTDPSEGNAWPDAGDTEGDDVHCLLYDATNDILYAGCTDNHVHRNTDPSTGIIWSDAGAPTFFDVNCLAYDASNDILYAGCNASGIYRNTNPGSGSTWDFAGDTGAEYIFSLSYDAANNNLYAGGGNGHVYRNTNPSAGTTWNDAGDTSGGTVHGLAFDGTNLYAGCNNGHVYRNTSPATGSTWADTGNTSGGIVYALTYDGANDILYAGTWSDHVYRNTSPGTGSTWQDAGNACGDGIYSLAFDGTNDILYAGCYNGHVSRNKSPGTGTTWTDAGDTSGGWVNGLAYDAANNILYAGGWSGFVLRNINPQGGNNWADTGLLGGGFVSCLSYDAAHGILYAGTGLGHVFRNTDPGGGGTWADAGDTTGTIVQCLAYDGTNDILYAGAFNNHVYRNTSPGTGSTWVDAGTMGGGVNSLAFDGTNLYAACDFGHVYRNTSPGTGNTWIDTGDICGGDDVLSFAYDGTSDILYAGCYNGHVYRNTDPGSGNTWADAGNTTGGDVYALTYDGAHNILYAACDNGDVYRNTDAGSGNTWADAGSATAWGSLVSLAYDGTDGTLYTGASDGHVYANADPGTGSTWADAGNLSGGNVNGLAYDGTNKILYAGTQSSNIFKGSSHPAPIITTIDPGSGNRGETLIGVEINGGDFRGPVSNITAQIKKGASTINIAVKKVSADRITGNLTIPGDAALGDWDVFVKHNDDGKSDTKSNAFEVQYPAPVVNSISPADGANDGTVSITDLAGSNFRDGATASLKMTGEKDIDATNVQVVSSSKITCDLDLTGAKVGNWDVYVENDDGKGGTLTAGFSVELPASIAGCDPDSSVQGHTVNIDITGSGTHFKDGTSTAVFSGTGITINSTHVTDANHAMANITIAPDAPTGFRDVNVITGDETPEALKNGFEVKASPPSPPYLDSIDPSSGSVGTHVTLAGQHFGSDRGSSYVSFNGTRACDYDSWSDGKVVCPVPSGATSGPVMVTTPAGTSNGIDFTVETPQNPLIKDCSPKGVVQGHTIDLDILGESTHFQQGQSAARISGGGVDVQSTRVSDADHATAGIAVASDAQTGTRDVNVITGSETPRPLKNVFTIHEAPTSPPELDNLHPARGQVGTLVSVVGKNFGKARGSSRVTFNGTPVINYVSWSDYEVVLSVPSGATSGPVKVETPWGTSNGVDFTVTNASFYFAEGTCRPDFEPYLTIQNLGSSSAEVCITYMKGDGTNQSQMLNVPATTRSTVAVKAVLGEGNDVAHDFSCKVESTNNQDIVVERPMYFNYDGVWTGGSDVVGAISPAEVFYFAEGTCRPGFEPYLTIQNPGTTATQVRITYMLGDGTTKEQLADVHPQSRQTITVTDFLGVGNDVAHDFSCKVESTNNQDIVVERPMYFNYDGVWTGGSDVVGAISPAEVFYFAEGTCRPGFEPYLTIQNPGIAAAQVKITFMKGDGTITEQLVDVHALSRSTVFVPDFLGVGNDVAHDFSCKVESTNNQDIVVERPMYFNYDGVWTGGSDVVGFSP